MFYIQNPKKNKIKNVCDTKTCSNIFVNGKLHQLYLRFVTFVINFFFFTFLYCIRKFSKFVYPMLNTFFVFEQFRERNVL